jgi:putative endonuclease
MHTQGHNPEHPKAQPVAALHGLQGEDMACRLLTALGYTVLGRNIRHGRGEVDILAMENGYLVCLEIKTRSSTTFGRPEQFINRKKRSLLYAALQEEVRLRHWAGPSRFDEIAILLLPDGFKAEVFRDVQYD